MNYQQALQYIHNTLQFGSKPGLTRIGALLEKMGNPQDKLRFVHVTGTNGKGSVCAATAAVLSQAGYKTGLYTSPYVTDFCERIQVDGKMISHEELAREVELIEPFVAQTARELESPTEFEIITALAFDYFKKVGCEVVVLEVGLGGRFDATNIIPAPLISVITSISYDHTAILGGTLDKIAFEKSGIIKSGGVTVSSPNQPEEALAVIQATARERNNPLIVPDMDSVHIIEENIRGSKIVYQGKELDIPLCGRHQIANFITVYEIADALRQHYHFHIDYETITRGMRQVRFPARLEILCDAPLVLLDGGHNPSAAQALAEAIDRYLKAKKLTTIMGIFRDKDYSSAIPMIASRSERFIAVRPDNPRALDAKITVQIASESCANTLCIDDYGQAFQEARRLAGDDGVILICGSFYLAGPMRKIVKESICK